VSGKAVCHRCGGKGCEPSPDGTPRIGAPSCMLCGGARKAPCPEAAERAAMSDGEFWERIYGPSARPDPHDYDPAHEAIGHQLDPCPTCGERGPCGYDAEGRPMIHTSDADEATR